MKKSIVLLVMLLSICFGGCEKEDIEKENIEIQLIDKEDYEVPNNG